MAGFEISNIRVILSMAWQKFKELRKKKHLTQSQLAEKLGVEKRQISKIENGKFNLMLTVINKMATALGEKVRFELQPI